MNKDIDFEKIIEELKKSFKKDRFGTSGEKYNRHNKVSALIENMINPLFPKDYEIDEKINGILYDLVDWILDDFQRAYEL